MRDNIPRKQQTSMPIANALRSSMFLRNSRGALTPSNLHWTFSVCLNRFTAEYKEDPHSMRDKKRNQGGIECRDNKQSKRRGIARV